MAFTITTEVSDQRVRDLLCCAMEGGISYWARVEGYDGDSGAVEFPHFEMPFVGGAVLIRGILDENNDQLLRLDREAIQRGLILMADPSKVPPYHLANFMMESEDAETGDVLVQLALFGEIVYG